MNLPKPIRKLIESFEKLPGMGPKTAARLTFYLLHVPQVQLEDFADALKNLKLKTVLCSICFNVSETDPCPICLDRNRDKSTICVVEQPLDILALEKAGNYKGVYHVLHGAISPLNNIGPEELYVKQLLDRVKGQAFVPSSGRGEGGRVKGLKITRLGQGLPTGADIEYADEVTLSRAIEGRREY